MPFTLDLSTTLYFHNYRNGLLLGISNSDQDPGFGRDFSYGWMPGFDAAARGRRAALVAPELVGGWAGLYENTPDHNALIGSVRLRGGFSTPPDSPATASCRARPSASSSGTSTWTGILHGPRPRSPPTGSARPTS